MPPLDGAGDGKEMPFLDHLEELRWRILYALLALVVGVVGAFVLLTRYKVLTILQGPILPFLNGGTLVYTHPADPFRITMTLALIIGTILALPVILFQLWSFVAPALYSHEKRIVIPVLMMGSLLFLAGLTLSWFVILPLTLGFLYNIQAEGLTAMITFREYFGFAISMSVALGLVFELPIVILALTALGVVTPQFLNRYRRHAVVLCLVGSAFITPGADPFSLLAIALPLYGLFEVSVVVSTVVYRRRQKREAARAQEAGATA